MTNDATSAAAKSALQRGLLRKFAQEPEDIELPILSVETRARPRGQSYPWRPFAEQRCSHGSAASMRPERLRSRWQ
jgi:hypothetical protein